MNTTEFQYYYAIFLWAPNTTFFKLDFEGAMPDSSGDESAVN